MIFQTERLLVRTYTETDEENFFALNGDENVMRYIRPAKTREESNAFLREVMAYNEREKLYGRWAVDDRHKKEFVGSFAIIPVEGKEQMQLGYALLSQHWGKGYATELTKEGLNYVFTKTDIDPIYAYTEGPNLSSQKVLLKAGFQSTGLSMEGEKEVAGFIFYKKDFLPRSH